MAKKKARTRPVGLCVERVAPTGEGLAMHDGRPVLVPDAWPGERIAAQLERGRGTVVERYTSDPERVEPRCALFTRCGGCDWMGASADLQRRLHGERLQDLLGFAVDVEEVGEPWGYRTRARLAVRVRGPARVGYRRARSRQLVELGRDRCHVLDARLQAVVEPLCDALRGGNGDGEVQLAIGQGGRPVVELRFRGELSANAFGAFDRAVKDRWAGARIWLDDVTAPASFGDPRPVMEGIDGRPLVFAPGSFGQPSIAGAQRLAAAVADWAGEAERGVELFAGSGTLTVALLDHVRQLTAVEHQEDAIRALRENVAARDRRVKAVVGDADAYALPRGLDLVVLDPPRIGASGAAERLLEARPRRVIYVACNPRALARDLATLRPWFEVVRHRAFALFPQTSHVEVVVELHRRAERVGR